MRPIEPIENFVLSQAFVKAAMLQRHKHTPITRTDFWAEANAGLVKNPGACDILFDCFHLKLIEGGISAKADHPLMSVIMVMSFSRDFTPADDHLLKFDKLSWALQSMPQAEKQAINLAFEAVVGQDLESFFDTHRRQAYCSDPQALSARVDENGVCCCEHTGKTYPAEVFAQRFWIQQIRAVYSRGEDGEYDCTPEQEITLLSTHLDLSEALDAMIQVAHEGNLPRSGSLHLNFLSNTLLQGFQETRDFVWQKPGAEYQDVPDYYNPSCGVPITDICKGLLERETRLGNPDRLLEHFLTIDLGL